MKKLTVLFVALFLFAGCKEKLGDLQILNTTFDAFEVTIDDGSPITLPGRTSLEIGNLSPGLHSTKAEQIEGILGSPLLFITTFEIESGKTTTLTIP